MKGIALFDFDGTLVARDSFLLFAHTTLGWVRVLRAVLLSSPWLVGWKLGVIGNGVAKQRLFGSLFGGCPIDRFNGYCHDFAAVLDRYVNSPLLEQVEKYKAEGYRVAIVSASISLWIAPWAEKHGIDTVIATEPEIDAGSGRLTGRFATANCHGAEKVARIRERFSDFDSYTSVAFSDNRSDFPMLQLATHATFIGKQ